jgi:transcriptional regulator with XRE-family HTH domain
MFASGFQLSSQILPMTFSVASVAAAFESLLVAVFLFISHYLSLGDSRLNLCCAVYRFCICFKDMLHLSKELKSLLARRRWSPSDLSRRAPVLQPSLISRILHGKQARMHKPTLDALALAFARSADGSKATATDAAGVIAAYCRDQCAGPFGKMIEVAIIFCPRKTQASLSGSVNQKGKALGKALSPRSIQNGGPRRRTKSGA